MPIGEILKNLTVSLAYLDAGSVSALFAALASGITGAWYLLKSKFPRFGKKRS